jgi:hypothetical protein
LIGNDFNSNSELQITIREKKSYLVQKGYLVNSPHCKFAPVNIAPTFIKIAPTSKSSPYKIAPTFKKNIIYNYGLHEKLISIIIKLR